MIAGRREIFESPPSRGDVETNLIVESPPSRGDVEPVCVLYITVYIIYV
jgi:hypothetical protein